MSVEATGLERVLEDSLTRFDASIGVTGCCSATDEALNYFCRAEFASNLMSVKATGLEQILEDSLTRFDASIGVTGCCSATDEALNYFCCAGSRRFRCSSKP